MNRPGLCSPLISFFCLTLLANSACAQLEELTASQQLLLRGNFAESNEAFAKLQKQFPVQATLGLARGHWEQGEHYQAIQSLDQQLELSPKSAQLLAQRANYSLQRGEWEDCLEWVNSALAVDAEQIHARWVQAEVWRNQGKTEAALEAYRKLASYYDQHRQKIESPQQLYWLAQALAQHARFNNDQKRFRELIDRLYPRMLSLEPNFWLAHFQSGMLLLEKYNDRDAEAAFNEALEINPQAADAKVGLAWVALNAFKLDAAKRQIDRALEINPQHQPAAHCWADMELASLRPAKAFQILTDTLESNPRSVQTLGRLAAAHQLLTTSTKGEHVIALQKLQEKIDDCCENTGEFHAVWGTALEHARRYPQAGIQLQKAIKQFPQLLGPRGKLGMIEMRLGHEDLARRWLEESFERDPYNVRVKNQLEVLDLLEDYTTLETEHFVIRYDAAHDQPLADCMARFVEQTYDELTATFGYQLPEKALIEIFRDGRGIKARQWFGARMVGLPNIHTIAACGGNVVAMVSPTAERRKLNWADIMRHELVHLINIQQTDYAVPHWLTEGCAVWQENRPRRPRWEKLLVKRVPRGEVFDLESINLGFLRPRSGDDWQLAYCQAEMYVELIVDRFGEEGIHKLLAAYRDNLPTEQAFALRLATEPEAIEESYIEYLSNETAQLAKQPELQESPKLEQAIALWEANPDNLAIGADLALVRLRQGDYPGAGRLAETILAREPTQPLAQLVKAKLLVRIGDNRAAAELLTEVTQAENPPLEALKLLANIRLQEKAWAEAQQLYQAGAKQQPGDLQWTKALAVVAIQTKDLGELEKLLTRIANAEPDNLVARKKLLQLANLHNQSDKITLWAEEVLHIDPSDLTALRAIKVQTED